AQGRAGKVFHIAKVQEQLAAPQLIDQTEELFTDNLDILLIQDLLVGEVHDRHIADIFHFQPAAPRLCRHKGYSFSFEPSCNGQVRTSNMREVENDYCMLEATKLKSRRFSNKSAGAERVE